MDTTTNPLHEFRSYSYHHILVACDTTAAAEQISGFINDTVTQNEGDFNDQIFQHHGAERGVVVRRLKSGGNYVVVINGARDSEFIITTTKWSTLIIPPVLSAGKETIHATTMATEGTMNILEPKGIRFINVINDVGNALLTGPTGITWVLKTIFIGQTDSGAPRFLTQNKPIMLFMANISGNFDEGGASYQFEFIGQTNGASKIPQFSSLKIPAINIPKEKNTLLDVFGYLTQAINDEYMDYLKQTDQLDDPGRLIKYAIELETETYAKPIYRIDELQVQQKGTYGFGRKLNIDQAITHLMMKCSKVKAEADGNPKHIFKIHSTLVTTETEAKVTFYVRRYVQPEATVIDGSKGINVPTDGNTLIYDYLYTGNNLDIVEFDIKMQMGLAFFQLLETTESLRDYQKEQPSSGDEERERESRINQMTEKQDDQKQSTSVRAPTKVDKKKILRIKYPGKKYTKNFQKNSKSGLSAADFQSALNQHAALENLEVKVSIHGNPILMSDMNIMPSEVTASGDSINKTELLTKWLHTPMFCKINIRMPASTSLTVDVGSEFSVPFWYQGFYTILAVEHSFKQGVFTQELDLLSIPEKTG